MHLANIFHLGIKELLSLRRDITLIIFILYAFSISVYMAATALPETLHKIPISIVDEDASELSFRLSDAFLLPYFTKPKQISLYEVDHRMNVGLDTFSIDIPPEFEKDMLAGRAPAIQVNIDATQIAQAFTGNEDIKEILKSEVNAYMGGHRSDAPPQIDNVIRIRFNQGLEQSWFGGVMEIISNITLLSMVLTGAALIREREHGTVEHLLVMPVTPFEIMVSKIWAMGLVVLVASFFSLIIVVKWLLAVQISGSILLFMLGTICQLFATTALGIFLGTIARSMPQFGLLLILLLIPLQVLAGTLTPRESMPIFVQKIMLLAPNTYFVMIAQAILYRGAGFSIVWPHFLALIVIGSVLFLISLARFRKTLALMV